MGPFQLCRQLSGSPRVGLSVCGFCCLFARVPGCLPAPSSQISMRTGAHKADSGPVSDSLSQVSVQWLRHHTLGHMAHGRPTEAQRGRVACPGSLVHSKPAGTGPRQGLLLDHNGLGSHATRSGEVREQPGWRWRTVSMLGTRCG